MDCVHACLFTEIANLFFHMMKMHWKMILKIMDLVQQNATCALRGTLEGREGRREGREGRV